MKKLKKTTVGTLAIHLHHATFTRQNQVVFSDLNWQLKPNEQWAIFGEVGAGKTTFLAALAGQLVLRSGTYALEIRNNENLTFNRVDRSSFRTHSALVTFQQQNSFFNYERAFYQQRYQSLESEIAIPTVQEVLAKAATTCTADEINEIINLLQLQDLLPEVLIKLSNGQTRKLQIARALLQKPKLLILDNPFTGLDEKSRTQLKQIIDSLTQQGTQILLATNQLEIPESITQVLWLDQFKIKECFSREDFFKFLPNTRVKEGNSVSSPRPAILLPEKTGKDFEVAVHMENVWVRYQNKVILEAINWIVKKGEKWALIGPNGSGKTTLLSLIYADNPQAFANKIYLFDKRKGSGESIWDIKKRIGFVSPELHLYFRQALTGHEVAATGYTDTLTRPKKLTKERETHIQDHFAFFDRPDLLVKPFLQMSAGEQRLVLLIRSVLKNAELLIWDEPFQGLSPEYIAQAIRLLENYCTPDTTLILVSHYAQEVPDFITNYVYLDAGKVSKIHLNADSTRCI
ncbi:ATP-binding cassette domain-containing protein [Adhaeribacter pallidiroseus]|uniref:Putative ABC transporter ATP-binding protein n=1 Tax=Adhaeribacter pallidiroseus TaxID=2072847 RepID=A0A369QG12_9BACT|nr:ATP-binding cassette domain-containing protein [Adhaeribacter pallidiroseus]RDC63230.1 putative ABC transporter ATP-binding protein [Adhaeribacter pallidiroseus]